MLRKLFGRETSAEPDEAPPSLSAEPRTAVHQSLAFLVGRPKWFAIWVVDADRNYYMQAGWSQSGETTGGIVRAEAVSDQYLKPIDALGTSREEHLSTNGWLVEAPGDNWVKSYAMDSGTDHVADELLSIMADVYGWHDGDPLSITVSH